MSKSDSTFSADGYSINKALLTAPNGREVDFADLIGGINFAQSLNSVSYQGSMIIVDSMNYLEEVPFRAEEKIDLEIQTQDLDVVLNLKLRVISISNLTYSDEGTYISYQLNFVSETTYEASKKRVIEAYSDDANNIAKSLFEKNYSKINVAQSDLPLDTTKYKLVNDRNKSFTVQKTEGLMDVIIPNYEPAEAIRFISTRSYNSKTPSQTFRFFETLDGYHFVTDEFLIENGKDNALELFYSPTASNEPNPDVLTKRVDAFSVNNTGRNTAQDLFSGAYRSKVYEIDFVRGEVITHKFNYATDSKFKDMNGEVVKTSNMPHTKEFMEETFTEKNAKEMMVFKDYASTGDYRGELRGEAHFPTIAQNRIAYYYHLNGTSLSMILKGRADIKPGVIINFSIKSTNDTKQNEQLSGKYLVSESVHSFNKGSLQTSINVIKLDWSGTGSNKKLGDANV